MTAREFKWMVFGTDDACEFVIIDDRFEPKKTYQFSVAKQELTCKGFWKNYSWKPTLVIPVGERRTPDEAKKLAQDLCDHLNAQWVKEKLSE